MPTLFRLVFVLAVLAGLGYGGLIALAYLVEPRTRDMSFTIPQERLNRDQPPR
jgi:phage shock protein PspC (stress-responsive transcriptional regulator)